MLSIPVHLNEKMIILLNCIFVPSLQGHTVAHVKGVSDYDCPRLFGFFTGKIFRAIVNNDNIGITVFVYAFDNRGYSLFLIKRRV